MQVLVTRPLPDAETTADELRRRGHAAIVAPMLVTTFGTWPHRADTPLPDVIVATSLNGIRGLERAPGLARLLPVPLYVPGDASAAQGRKTGFTDVRPVHGDAGAIRQRIAVDLPEAAHILYVAGADRSIRLDTQLRADGHRVDRVEIYRATPATCLPDAAIAALTHGQIDRILIFSARTGGAFVDCLAASELLPLSRGIQIHAISRQAAEPLREAGFRAIVIAARPDAAELLDTLATGG